MANQQNSYTVSQGSGTGNRDFDYTFPSFTEGEVKVEIDNVVKTLTTHYTIVNHNATSGGTVRFNATGLPNGTAGTTPVRIFRQTDVDNPKAEFTAGSSLKAGEINDNFKQVLHALQESIGADATDRKIQTFNIEDQAITSAKIKDLTIVDADIAAGAEIEVYKLKDGGANQVLVTQSDGTTVGWSSSVDLGGTLDVTGNVDFDANLNVDGNLEVDGTTNLDNTNIAGDLYVVGTALVDNVLIDGSSIESGSGNLNLSATGGSNVTVNDNLAVTGTLNVTQGVTLQNATATVNGSQIVTETASQTLTNKTLTTPVINDMSGTAVVTSGTSNSDTKVYSAKRAEERFYGKDTVGEIQSGETWSSADDKVATTAAIDARIIDLVDDVGGFVPIANETSFPTTNPDINTSGNAKGGTIVSVKTASTNLVPSGTTVTIANGRGSGLAVIITGVPSTIPSGFGFLVETTATDHTYAFHRLTPKATEVTTVAGIASNITSVANNTTNINAVANNETNINAVKNNETNINTVAGKATEIGRLGTADAVADMAILGTADVVSDLNTLGTADVVADMNMLATSDVVADMNMLAVADVISDMDDLATSGNITAMSTCSTNIASINNCSTNISSVNYFGDVYQVANSNPSTDGGGNQLSEGDLYFNTSANRLKVYDGSSWVNGVEISGSGAVTTGNTFTGDNRYNDNVKALFGTGSDLEIYHSGADSYIKDVGTGHLFIEASHTLLRSIGGENQVKLHENGSVELYYDNSKKFETLSNGASITGRLGIGTSSPTDALHVVGTSLLAGNSYVTGHFYVGADNKKINIGASSDLQLYHDGTDSFLSNSTGGLKILGDTIRLKGKSVDENMLVASANGSIELYENNVKKAETTTDGFNVEGILYSNGIDMDDNHIAKIGTGDDLQIYHDGSTSYVSNTTNTGLLIRNLGNGDIKIKPQNSYPVELYYNGAKKLETTSAGTKVTGVAEFRKDTTTTNFSNLSAPGANDSGLYVQNVGGTTGNFAALTAIAHSANSVGMSASFIAKSHSTGYSPEVYITQRDGSNSQRTAIKISNPGAVELNYAGSKKLETASDKVTFYADAKVSAHNTYTLGADGARWRDLWIANNIYLPDAGEVRLGNSGDLQLYHTGSDSYINDTGTGSLILVSNAFKVKNSANNEAMIYANENGAVELYYDNSKRVDTYVNATYGSFTASNGRNGWDGMSVGANKFTFMASGTSDQAGIFNDIDDEWMLRATRNAQTDLRYDGSIKFNTSSSGCTLTGTLTTTSGINAGNNISLNDGHRVKFGNSDDLQIVHDGNHSYIEDTGTGSLILKSSEVSIQSANGLENIATFTQDSVVKLYENSALKLQTGSGGAYGSVEAKTGKNGWSGYSIGGYYVFMSNNEGNADTAGIFNDLDDEWMFRGQRNGYTRMYYNGSEKIETTSIGAKINGGLNIDGGTVNHTGDATVYIHANANSDWGLIVDADADGKSDYGCKIKAPTSAGYAFACAGVSGGSETINFLIDGNGNVDKSGHIYPSSSNSKDLGSTSLRWRNIYTNDLNLSNEGSSNDVDGSWGDWTIQEGESDLFLKNNRSGKKYKFNLTEVS